MSIKQQATDHAVQHTTAFAGSKVATGMTYGGGATAFVGGLTLNEFAIVFGMVIGLLGFCLQIYQTIHKHRVYTAERKLIAERAERERVEHIAKMEMFR